MAFLKKSTPKKSETKIVPDATDGTGPYVTSVPGGASFADDETLEGQLSVDVFQTAEDIVVVAPVAGVSRDELSITITDEVLTIRGKRGFEFTVSPSDYYTQECFWGNFSRSVILPESVDTARVNASFKNGILTIRIPKVEKIKTRLVKIRGE